MATYFTTIYLPCVQKRRNFFTCFRIQYVTQQGTMFLRLITKLTAVHGHENITINTNIHTYSHTLGNRVLMSSLRKNTSYNGGGPLAYVANTNPREKVWSQINENIRFRVRNCINWLQLVKVFRYLAQFSFLLICCRRNVTLYSQSGKCVTCILITIVSSTIKVVTSSIRNVKHSCSCLTSDTIYTSSNTLRPLA